MSDNGEKLQDNTMAKRQASGEGDGASAKRPRTDIQEYISIPVRSILIQKHIAAAVRAYGGCVKEFKGDPTSPPVCPLNRMEHVLEGMRDGVQLPPIKVKQYLSTGYYCVLDGRHRFAASIVLGCTDIRAEIVA